MHHTHTHALFNGAEESAKHMFLDDPGLSIDEAARKLAHEGRGLSKAVISRIRMECRQTIFNAHTSLPTQGAARPPMIRKHNVVQPQPPPFNPPRLSVVEIEDERPVAAPAPAPVPVPAPEPRPTLPPPLPTPKADLERNEIVKDKVPLELKKAWISDWAMAHPLASVAKARLALKERFGETMSTTYIHDTLKVARELMVKPSVRVETPAPVVQVPTPIFTARQPTGQSIAEIAHYMRDAGIKMMEIVGDHFRVELEGDVQ